MDEPEKAFIIAAIQLKIKAEKEEHDRIERERNKGR